MFRPRISHIWLKVAVILCFIVSFCDSEIKYPQRRSYVRRQQYLIGSFPCSNITWTGRSVRRPTSVHQLRPGDIDVVGAIGDSLIAGNGALEEYALGAFIEYRGVSWCTGGDGSWRDYLTLPNILKEFNPGLKGYSTGTGEFLEWNSKFNLAFPVASDRDALRQAKRLVARMRGSQEVDVENDWKMITVFMGANDLCSWSCGNKESFSARAHAEKIGAALDYFKQNLPRTFINLVPVLDVSVSVRVSRSPMCRLMHSLFCSCFHQWTGRGEQLHELVNRARLYQKAEKMLVNSGRYDDKEDFTVVYQPFMELFNAPLPIPKSLPPVIHNSYITYDCFHFSQKGHALAANLLWNNMLEPVGMKTAKWPAPSVMEYFKCPNERSPYLFTRRNSNIYYKYGRQVIKTL